MSMAFTNKLAIASVSLGQHPSHTLDQKMAAASHHGFSGIEIVYSDLEAFSKSNDLTILKGADTAKSLCKKHNLTILSLNPFKNFEGHNSPFISRITVAQHWLAVARRLGAIYLQVPSQFDPNSTGDRTTSVSELRQLADLAASEELVVSIAYEAVAWATHNTTWQSSLEIVEAVDRPNFGICLDSFHIMSLLWGDNSVAGGIRPEGPAELEASLTDLVHNCPLERIFYIQISDAELFDPPLGPGHELYNEKDDRRLIWSRKARPFPLEREFGGYFPVAEFVNKCLVEKKWKGWVSFEVFDRRMLEAGNGPEKAAERGRRSWERILEALSS
ncbi:related to 4-hydroxyphenylpyruvate dioxygenase [Phialocephala subalpina]|uniref:Related to 4-hydroxyphenylpyruvate dioxygenase n=1 Tax=Phialocephala subalpina TaxID=576137 RepID=A0A1L7XH86_9HELO|nr:related to 4-hydroxyphenylpyruvate dioxygenase [Phialocephala subalpina]